MNVGEDIRLSLESLQAGGLILYPTDTIWGIGCDATSQAAVARVYQLKKRSNEKSMIVLVKEQSDVYKYARDVDPAIVEFLEKSQRPITVVYKNARNLAANLIGADGSIAIRIVKDSFCKQLIAAFGKPIVSTSANYAGNPAPGNFNEISEEIKKNVDYIVNHRQDDLVPRQSSTVIRWDDGKPVILRP